MVVKPSRRDRNPGTFSLRNSSIVTTLHFTRVTPDPCDLSSPSLFFSPTWYVVCVFRNKIVPCVSTDSSRDERKEATKKLASHGGDFSDNAAQRSRELGTGSFYEGDLLTEIKRGYVIREIVEARTAI